MGYLDLRHWLNRLEEAGQLAHVTAEVDWRDEIPAITRKSLNAMGPALLFENIKDYQNTWCRKLFVNGLGNGDMIKMMFNRPRDVSRRELVDLYRDAIKNPLAPEAFETGPVKENIRKGDQINLWDFPVPKWHALDGGRYINTWCGVVTRDPDTGIMNVGTYRGMIVDETRISCLLLTAQHWGMHLTKYAQRGEKMPVAVVFGYDPSMVFVACSAIPTNMCEYDVMGAIRGVPVDLVKCETSDLMVPSSAEIVLEGFVDPHPETFAWEGGFGEYTGYYAGERRKRPVIQVECITHRNDPIYRGNLEGAGPGEPNEDSHVYAISAKGLMFDTLERAGIPGVLDCRPGPINIIKIKQSYRGQAKQIACALWAHPNAEYMWKMVLVVDEDIDIYNERSVQWAMCYRVDPANLEHLVVMPGTRGGVLDPSSPAEVRDDVRFGTGSWNRLLIDATRDLSLAKINRLGEPEWEPLATWVPPDQMAAVEAQWDRYGIPLPKRGRGRE